MVVAFLVGVGVGHYRVPPFAFLKQAMYAAHDLWWWAELKLQKRASKHPHVIVMSHPRKPISPSVENMAPGATAVVMYRDDRFGVVLVDASGTILHRWKIPETLLDDLIVSESWSMDKGHYTIHGAHVFQNGDLVFNIEGTALVRVDQCSRLLWVLKEPVHHSVFVDDADNIWVPSKRTISEPEKALAHMVVPYEEDLILRVSPDGRVLETISLLDAIYEGNYQGVLLAGGQDFPTTTELDPTHLNDVEIISAEFAKRNKFANQGDILVSMRTIDTVAIIDRVTRKMKWTLAGPFLRQHDPDAIENGHLLVFDNRTDKGQHNEARYRSTPQSFGYSRVLEVDPSSQEIVWSYSGSKGEPFYTSIQGKLQFLSNGNVLIVETEGGRVFEVSRITGRIVWEYRNVLGDGEDGQHLGRVTGATRIPWDYSKLASAHCGDE